MATAREQAIDEEKVAERVYQREQAKAVKEKYKYVAPSKDDVFRIASLLRPDQGRDVVLEYIDPELFRKVYPAVLLERQAREEGHEFSHYETVDGKQYMVCEGKRYLVENGKLVAQK